VAISRETADRDDDAEFWRRHRRPIRHEAPPGELCYDIRKSTSLVGKIQSTAMRTDLLHSGVDRYGVEIGKLKDGRGRDLLLTPSAVSCFLTWIRKNGIGGLLKSPKDKGHSVENMCSD
jgi:hypothetical protein